MAGTSAGHRLFRMRRDEHRASARGSRPIHENCGRQASPILGEVNASTNLWGSASNPSRAAPSEPLDERRPDNGSGLALLQKYRTALGTGPREAGAGNLERYRPAAPLTDRYQV